MGPVLRQETKMAYMNIIKIDGEDDKYRIDYVTDQHSPQETVVNGVTARLLECAKKTGADVRAREIRLLLGLSW
jgi:hypothetical protein